VGAGIGGFLNASFGNAPELIVALTALTHGLPDVVRASLAGSIASNLLLVLGLALVVRTPGKIDRASARVSLATIGVAVLVFAAPAAAAAGGGDPDRHALAALSVPFALALLIARVVFNTRRLRWQSRLRATAATPDGRWSLRRALVTLALATALTAIATDLLVGSLEPFADQAGLPQLFVAAVIVAIVGNAAEHGSAVVVAVRGNTELASEIALASSAQVAAFLVPLVALLSWTIEPMALSFRPVELAAMGAATAAVAIVLTRQPALRLGGGALVLGYVVVVASFYFSGSP
jgi:Ca2+:H+ antiporter